MEHETNRFDVTKLTSSQLSCRNIDLLPTKIDPVEEAVREIWNMNPGIGIKMLCAKVNERLNESHGPSGGVIAKARIKAAKALLPYTRLDSDIQSTDQNNSVEKRSDQEDKLIGFVEQKLQERQSLRLERRWKESDFIGQGLKAMGIVIDDDKKHWSIDAATSFRIPTTELFETTNVSAAATEDSTACGMCGRFFASRNLVFKHLRDPSSGCGTSIFATGQSIGAAPSAHTKQRKKEKHLARMTLQKTGRTKRHADADSSVWMGDLPLIWTRHGGQYKRLRALLRAYLPRDVPQPWIKKVVRKAYRSRRQSRDDGAGDENIEDDRPYLGYAIVVFRDAEEASSVIAVMDGTDVSPRAVFDGELEQFAEVTSFRVKVRSVENNESRASSSNEEPTRPDDDNLATNSDISLTEQLRPLSIDELLQRTLRLESLSNNATHSNERVPLETQFKSLSLMEEREATLQRAVRAHQHANNQPNRKEVHLLGKPIPAPLLHKLLPILQSLRWTVPNHRQGLTAERYLVLQTNVHQDRFYGELRNACRELMEWADPDYYYSGIAVTKNFVASPHIDERDTSFQYAVSLGDFRGGGQLCVEGKRTIARNGSDGVKQGISGHTHDGNDVCEEYVNVVDTQNRIVRVDGRNVHWVRPWDEADRYSLIFYDTSDRFPTPITESGVDLEWLA